MAWTRSLFLFLFFAFTPYHIIRGILIVLRIFFNPFLFKRVHQLIYKLFLRKVTAVFENSNGSAPQCQALEAHPHTCIRNEESVTK
jgi:hypothetical protein